MAEIPDTIQEERQELMVTGKANPTLRIAHFLAPSITEPFKDFPPLPPFSLPAASSDLKNLLHKVEFKGWLWPNKSWKMWVEHFHSTYHSTWKKVGIYEAIMSTTKYKIRRDAELILRVAENWCSETNTFIFPWGEATVTLEDMMVLGGYPTLGDSVLSPLEELKETEIALLEAYDEVYRETGQVPRRNTWIDYFIARKECKFAHEAFLSMWLSRYVFPLNYDIGRHVFPIAICLARGTPVALAPAVLAGIYRDLGSLKKKIVESNKAGTGEGKDESMLCLFSQIHLVQLWVWERFPTLRPKPNLIECGEPRLARWNKLKKLLVENVRLTIDSDGEFFQWRPYAATVKNWSFHKFYKENEERVLVDSELESIARCMRVSELVGFDCIQQYLPHRVAMQFGLDQDVPGCVFRSNGTPEIAWRNYNRPIIDAKLYIPPRLYESDVTIRYFNWWTQWMLVLQDAIRGVVRRPRSLPRRAKNVKRLKKAEDSLNEDTLTIKELLQLTDKQHSTENRLVGNVSHLLDSDDRTLPMKTIEKNVHTEAVVDESEEVVEDIRRIKELLQLTDEQHSTENRLVGDVESFLQNDHSVGAHLSLGVPSTELENQLMEVETQAKLDAKQMSKESGSKQSGIKSNGVDLVVDLNTYVSINGNCDHGNGNQDIVVEEQMTNIEKSNNTGKKKVKPTASKSGFSASDLVWGKIMGHPWWPGQIFDPSDSSKKSMNYFKNDSFLIAYFGDGTFAWNEASKLKPFEAHFSHMEKQSNMETFRHAVDCALDEVASRAEFGLSCPCLSEGLYSNIKSQIVVNSGIQTESRRRDAGDQYSSATSFEPAKLVDYIKALGRCSYGAVDRLEFVIAQAQLLSLYRWKGYPQLPSQSPDNEVSCSHSTVEITELLQLSDKQQGSENGLVGDVEHLLESRPVGDVEHLLASDYQTLSSCNMNTVMNKEEELLKKCKEKNVQHEAVGKESEEALIQRIRELFQLSDKQQSLENRLVGDVEPLLDSDNRTFSTCNTCTEINKEENLPMTSIEKNVQSEPLAKESEKVVENIKENNPEIAVIDIASQCPDNEVSCSHSKDEIPGLELEARISKLEKVIAGLKAAYIYHNNFMKKNHEGKVNPIHSSRI